MLSDTEWESLCLGYFIIEYDYVPSGLRHGKTLKDYDLVGKTLKEGKKILAQCKKNLEPYPVDESFLEACKRNKDIDAMWFWCAYGGWGKDSHDCITLVDKDCIMKWLDTDKGKKYLAVLQG